MGLHPESEISIDQLAYDVAYFVLPQYLFENLEKIIEICQSSPTTAGGLWYLMACSARQIEPDFEVAKQFRWHHGLIGTAQQYLALEYPEPTPLDIGDSDPMTLLESGIKMVLAPYFSVIVYAVDTEPEYYILGQTPLGGGTTFRQLQERGNINCNLGPGPEPVLDRFISAIEERLAST